MSRARTLVQEEKFYQALHREAIAELRSAEQWYKQAIKQQDRDAMDDYRQEIIRANARVVEMKQQLEKRRKAVSMLTGVSIYE